MPTNTHHRQIRPLLWLTLLAFALRAYGLHLQPLWGDEGWSIYFATMPLSQMVALTAVDIHPPLYYALLHSWFALTGPGAEVARFISVICGTLLVPVTYQVTRFLHPPQTNAISPHLFWPGLFSAGVVTCAPLAIYYSQEVRIYGLVTLLGLLSTLFFVHGLRHKSHSLWPYILSSTLALYTMYYALFIIIGQGLYLLGRYRLRHPLFKGLIGIGLGYLPWVIYAGGKLVAYVSQKVDVEGYQPLNLFTFLGNYLTAFSQGHLSPAFAFYHPLTWLFVLLAALGLYQLSRTSHAGWKYTAPVLGLYLGLPLLLGWVVNLINPFTPPRFERTLLLAAPAWWIGVGLGLAYLHQKQRRLFWLAGGLLVVSSGLGLTDFYRTPRYPEADYRPMLARIAAQASPQDVVLASYQWQLGFYYAYLPEPRPQLYPVPAWGVTWGTDAEAMRRDLTALLAEHPLWFPAHQTAGHIWEDEAEAMMADLGYPTWLYWFNKTTKLSLVGPQQPLAAGSRINFENILGADLQLPEQKTYPSGHGIIPVKIDWQPLTRLTEDYLITLKLVDNQGEVWAKRDVQPHADQVSFVNLSPGDQLLDKHGLLVTAGTPPGLYDLRLSLTRLSDGQPLNIMTEAGQPQGTEATLTTIEIEPAQYTLGVAALPRQVIAEIPFEMGLNLVGYSLGTRLIETGEFLPVNLFWQSKADALPSLTMFVQLQNQAGEAVALTERPPVYPTEAWLAGTLLRDLHRVRIPATLAPGRYTLAAGVLQADKSRLLTSDGDQIILGDIQVESRPHHFTLPTPQYALEVNFSEKATLLGYDLNQTTPTVVESLTLTLYWRSEGIFERKWAVFTHLVDENGQIWAQQDQFPGAGAFPTTSWIPGEIISDTRHITLSPETPPGRYTLVVGFYNPLTFERLPLQGGGDAVEVDQSILVR